MDAMLLVITLAASAAIGVVTLILFHVVVAVPGEDRTFKERPPGLLRIVWLPTQVLAWYLGPRLSLAQREAILARVLGQCRAGGKCQSQRGNDARARPPPEVLLRAQQPLSHQIRHTSFIGDPAPGLSDRYHNAATARGAATEIWRNPYGATDENFTNVDRRLCSPCRARSLSPMPLRWRPRTASRSPHARATH